jgi:ABC-type nickel/cobalt efflux system permease component RcnA
MSITKGGSLLVQHCIQSVQLAFTWDPSESLSVEAQRYHQRTYDGGNKHPQHAPAIRRDGCWPRHSKDEQQRHQHTKQQLWQLGALRKTRM